MRLRVAFAATALGVGPLALMPGVAALAIWIFVAGLGISATLVSSYSITERAVAAEQSTEGMSWLTTAAATGTAIGAPVAGRLVDAHGAGAGYLFALAAGLVGLALLATRARDLRPAGEERAANGQPADSGSPGGCGAPLGEAEPVSRIVAQDCLDTVRPVSGWLDELDAPFDQSLVVGAAIRRHRFSEIADSWRLPRDVQPDSA